MAFDRWSKRKKSEQETLKIGKKPGFRCHICGKMIQSKKSNLDRHMKLHSEHDEFKCVKCGRQYQTEGNFKAHLSRHHKGEDPKLVNFVKFKKGANAMPRYT